MVDSVNLQAVTSQRAPLGEGLFAVVAPIWTDSCKEKRVSQVQNIGSKSSITCM